MIERIARIALLERRGCCSSATPVPAVYASGPSTWWWSAPNRAGERPRWRMRWPRRSPRECGLQGGRRDGPHRRGGRPAPAQRTAPGGPLAFRGRAPGIRRHPAPSSTRTGSAARRGGPGRRLAGRARQLSAGRSRDLARAIAAHRERGRARPAGFEGAPPIPSTPAWLQAADQLSAGRRSANPADSSTRRDGPRHGGGGDLATPEPEQGQAAQQKRGKHLHRVASPTRTRRRDLSRPERDQGEAAPSSKLPGWRAAREWLGRGLTPTSTAIAVATPWAGGRRQRHDHGGDLQRPRGDRRREGSQRRPWRTQADQPAAQPQHPGHQLAGRMQPLRRRAGSRSIRRGAPRRAGRGPDHRSVHAGTGRKRGSVARSRA